MMLYYTETSRLQVIAGGNFIASYNSSVKMSKYRGRKRNEKFIVFKPAL